MLLTENYNNAFESVTKLLYKTLLTRI